LLKLNDVGEENLLRLCDAGKLKLHCNAFVFGCVRFLF